LAPTLIWPRLPILTDQGRLVCNPQKNWVCLISNVVIAFRRPCSNQLLGRRLFR